MHMETYSSFLYHCQNLKGIKMSSVGERTNELWYIQTMKWYQPWKGMKNHQCLLLSEITNLRNTHAVRPTAWHFAKGKLRTVKQSDFFLLQRWRKDKQAEQILCVILHSPSQASAICELWTFWCSSLFRKGRGTRDQIANIHWIMGKAKEFQKNI